METGTTPLRVALVATPDAQVGPLSGLYETLNAFGLLRSFEPDLPERPFAVEVVAPSAEPIRVASGLTMAPHRPYDEVERSDIVIVPLMTVEGPDWVRGRYPGLVAWLREQHERGAMLASACTGVLLLAETGLLSGREATIHWAFEPTFRRNFPDVRVRPEKVLITSGEGPEFLMTGGVMSWHDLALHLIATNLGPSAAHGMARLLMLEWHGEGQMPYMAFAPRLDHGDARIADLQGWLSEHIALRDPVRSMVKRAGMSRRTLERRFRAATGYAPIAYAQQLRIAEAKRRLERTTEPVEAIGFAVGYENTAFFRRVFKRATQLAPGAYRRKFQMPGL